MRRRFWIPTAALLALGHDEACTACLKWLQARCGLPVTGELDRRTWQHMVRLYAQTVGDGTGSYPVRITHPEGAQTPQRV